MSESMIRKTEIQVDGEWQDVSDQRVDGGDARRGAYEAAARASIRDGFRIADEAMHEAAIKRLATTDDIRAIVDAIWPARVAADDALAEVAALRQQLDEARTERDEAEFTTADVFAKLLDVQADRDRLAGALAAAQHELGARDWLIAQGDAERERLLVVLRALADSWRHDPDCQVGRRELGGKGCAHFTERWRDQCRAELLAALAGSAAPAEPAPGDVGGVPVDTEEADD